MTQEPEEPSGVYLATENSGKSANTNFCLRMGCTRWRAVATPIPVETLDPINAARIISQRHIKFVSQLSVDVPCAPPSTQRPPKLLPVDPEKPVWWAGHCGVPPNVDRDCLSEFREAPNYAAALANGKQYAYRPPRFYEIFDRPGGQLLARGTGY